MPHRFQCNAIFCENGATESGPDDRYFSESALCDSSFLPPPRGWRQNQHFTNECALPPQHVAGGPPAPFPRSERCCGRNNSRLSWPVAIAPGDEVAFLQEAVENKASARWNSSCSGDLAALSPRHSTDKAMAWRRCCPSG